jgi:hypothetical protein
VRFDRVRDVTAWPSYLLPLRRWMTGWPDPPWIMSGTTVTVWFEPPEFLLSALLGDTFADHDNPGRLARVRFYDVVFSGHGTERRDDSNLDGSFREAVVAVPARAHDVTGEISTYMWTDSQAYLTWGREVFGWPLQAGAFELDGPLWSGAGVTGSALARSPNGTIAVSISAAASPAPSPAEAGPVTWLTPRRLLYPAGPYRETVQITAIVPQVITAGSRLAVDATAKLSFGAGHILSSVAVQPVRSEIHRDFELLVGSTAEVIHSWER